MLDQLPEVPAAVREALDRLKDELTQAAGANLAGLVLYGGVARGRYHPQRSDVNVVVLLHDASAAALAAIVPALRAASRSAAVVPLILAPTEVATAARAFPIKFLDIRDHHVVLAGTNPFAGLEIPPEQIRTRVSQELQNLLLRLRGRFVALAGDEPLLVQTLVRTARPFALQLGALLRLAGRNLPADDRTSAVFAAAAAEFGFEREPLARLAALRQKTTPDGDVIALYRDLLEAVEKAVAVAGGLPSKAS